MTRPPEVWWSPGRGGGLYVRSQHGGFKKVASNATGCAWSSSGADGHPDTLPEGARLLGILDDEPAIEITVDSQHDPVAEIAGEELRALTGNQWRYKPARRPFNRYDYPHPAYATTAHHTVVDHRRINRAEDGYQPVTEWLWACSCRSMQADYDTREEAEAGANRHQGGQL